MESLTGFANLSIDRVQFVDLCPENWKCDVCANLGKIIYKTSAHFYIDNYGFQSSKNVKSENSSKCPHKFCPNCFDELLADSRSLKCPIDSIVLPKKAFTAERLDAETIMEKDVYCLHKSRGCKKISTLREIEEHVKNCVYGLINCPLKCGQGVIIKLLADHMSSECPRRTANCQFCGDDIPLKDRKDHENNCIKRPVICTYCKRKTLFMDLRKHFEICPIKPRNCRLSIIGCEFVGIKEEIDNHESVWKNHVDYFVKFLNTKKDNFLDDSKFKFGEVYKEINTLTQENVTLKRTISRLSSHLENVEREALGIKQEMIKMEMEFKNKLEKMNKGQLNMVDIVEKLKAIVLDEASV